MGKKVVTVRNAIVKAAAAKKVAIGKAAAIKTASVKTAFPAVKKTIQKKTAPTVKKVAVKKDVVHKKDNKLIDNCRSLEDINVEASELSTAETVFGAIQSISEVQIRALLFAACRNHDDVAQAVISAAIENGMNDEDEDEDARC